MSRTDSGFSLVEMLVALAIVSVVLAGAGGLLAASRVFAQRQTGRVEAMQSLRATLDALARDLRLGGACLPGNGSFVALAGTDGGTADTVTTRAGRVRADLTCIRTALRADLSATDSVLAVDSADGFDGGSWVYLRHPGGAGEFFSLSGARTDPHELTKGGALVRDYPAGSGVYAVEERTYAIDASAPDLPVLTIATDGGAPEPFASGVERLDVQYRLARNCPSCDQVSLPADEAEWWLVTELDVSVGVRGRSTEPGGGWFRQQGRIHAKPRNLLPRAG